MLYAGKEGSAAPLSWSHAGAVAIGYGDPGSATGFDLGVFSFSDRSFDPSLVRRFNEHSGEFSPDGRFLAFDSDETGQREVYVQGFPDSVDRWRVSTEGGANAFWRSDGRELYFVRKGSELVAVPVGAPTRIIHADRLRPALYD